ncbi:MAG TPA: 20S proteasome subunit A/B [Methylomirabilota bacterium]|nr:20S proteasome subunit A/B [Methylomirabilota bacterium]
MTDEPYRWLEAIGNRREYVRDQLKGGSPVFAAKLQEGILLLGVGAGNSKVFELFDRHALSALGHPADIEKIRQAAIDAAHMEAFTRAPDDVSLRRLVTFGLSPQLKTNFEQIFSAPFVVELILTELGLQPQNDLVVRLRFDGSLEFQTGPAVVAAPASESERAAQQWLNGQMTTETSRAEAVERMLEAWWVLRSGKNFEAELPSNEERMQGWRSSVEGRVVEIGFLDRQSRRAARYQPLTLQQLGL